MKLVTIKTSTYEHDLLVVRALLESSGIETFLQGEYTTQVYPLFSNAIGGVKLQVKDTDVERAVEILRANGNTVDIEPPLPKIWSWLDKYTAKIPLLKKLRMELRVILAILIILVLIFIPVYISLLPKH